MEEDAAIDLARLHDVVVPPEVSWWPPAPGWFVLAALLLVALAVWGWRSWRRWRAEAYRREALRELEVAPDAATIAELLRRTALAVAPRETLSELQGESWVAWLDSRGPSRTSPEIAELLASGIYRRQKDAASESKLAELRTYAGEWIRHHRKPHPIEPC